MFINKKINNNIYYFKLYEIEKEEFNNFILNFSLLFEQKKNIKIIFDLSSLSISDFLYSKKMLCFMKENKENTEKYIDETVLIIPNNFIRDNIEFFIFNLYKPIKPNKITNSIENAIKCLNK